MLSKLFKLFDSLMVLCFTLIYHCLCYIFSKFSFFFIKLLFFVEYFFKFFLEKLFLFFIKNVVVYFIAIPWYIFDTFINPMLLKPTGILIFNVWDKNDHIGKPLVTFLLSSWRWSCWCYTTCANKVWKKFIDFLFFKIKRHYKKYKKQILYFYRICCSIFFLWILSYIHNIIFSFLYFFLKN